MELNDFIAKFAGLFEETDVNEFKPDTYYRELDEWSSLMALSIIAMVDEEYGVTINGNEMRSAETIEDLYTIIKSKM